MTLNCINGQHGESEVRSSNRGLRKNHTPRLQCISKSLANSQTNATRRKQLVEIEGRNTDRKLTRRKLIAQTCRKITDYQLAVLNPQEICFLEVWLRSADYELISLIDE